LSPRPNTQITPEGFELFRDGDRELARVVRAGFAPQKSVFATPNEFRQQLGFIVYGAGKTIGRHKHNPIRREIVGTPEVVLVRSGRCAVDLFDDDDAPVGSVELGQGDVIVFVSGGHGFRMIEDTILLEVKQGPYTAEQDKVHF